MSAGRISGTAVLVDGDTGERGSPTFIATRVPARRPGPPRRPFFIETALPGDVLAVHVARLRLDRDWAVGDDAIVSRAVDNDLAVKLKDAGKTIRGRLDRERGTATPDKPTDRLRG